jgi:hypothetical protein
VTVLRNHHRQTAYYVSETSEVISRDRAFDHLKSTGAPYRASFGDHFGNGVPAASRPDSYTPIVGLYPLPARTCWRVDRGVFHALGAVEHIPKLAPFTFEELDRIARHYVNFSQNYKIAVELSGGLDSSVVLASLRRVGVEPVLVGFISDRYEFRTEREIQNALSLGSAEVSLLNGDDFLPFSKLTDAPAHVLPCVSSLFHVAHQAMCDSAMSLGAKYVLNGVGGDPLFCDHISPDHEGFIGSHQGWCLSEPWPNDYVYEPRCMSYVPTYSLWPIPYLVSTLRRSQGEDPQKRFIRNLFGGQLPSLLTEFAYKADHGGPFYDGLIQARPCISEIARTAFEVTGDSRLEPRLVVSQAERAIHLQDSELKQLLSKLSFSTWLHAFVRDYGS